MKYPKDKNKCFPTSLNPKIRFLGQKVCSVARLQTDIHEIERGHPFSFNLSSRIGPKYYDKIVFIVSCFRAIAVTVEMLQNSNNNNSGKLQATRNHPSRSTWNDYKIFDELLIKFCLNNILKRSFCCEESWHGTWHWGNKIRGNW